MQGSPRKGARDICVSWYCTRFGRMGIANSISDRVSQQSHTTISYNFGPQNWRCFVRPFFNGKSLTLFHADPGKMPLENQPWFSVGGWLVGLLLTQYGKEARLKKNGFWSSLRWTLDATWKIWDICRISVYGTCNLTIPLHASWPCPTLNFTSEVWCNCLEWWI